MIRHYGSYPKRMIRQYVIHPTIQKVGAFENSYPLWYTLPKSSTGVYGFLKIHWAIPSKNGVAQFPSASKGPCIRTLALLLAGPANYILYLLQLSVLLLPYSTEQDRLDSRRLGAGDRENVLFYFFFIFLKIFCCNFLSSSFFFYSSIKQYITSNLLFLPLCAGPVNLTTFPGGYSTFILVYVCGPKGRKWGLKERVGTENRGLKELFFFFFFFCFFIFLKK